MYRNKYILHILVGGGEQTKLRINDGEETGVSLSNAESRAKVNIVSNTIMYIFFPL
jgi:hypothetical protein